MEWVELDPWGRLTGSPFLGSHDELVEHLKCLAFDGKIKTTVEHVLLCRVDDWVAERVATTLVVMSTPWGRVRWIPRPRTSKSRRDKA